MTLGSLPPPVMMRWQTLDSERNVTLASLLSRGADPVELTLLTATNAVTVTAKGTGWQREIKLDGALLPVGGDK